MEYSIIRAIHIIFVVSYFAGLFYIVRLFIYHTEALLDQDGPKKDILHEQFSFMEERLWNIITVPAFIIMILSGTYMLYLGNWAYLEQGWMHVKLGFILILFIYHFWSWRTLKQLHQAKTRMSSTQLRMMNEVATLILFVVVFAVVLKAMFIANWFWALISFVAMGVFIMLVVKIVNRGKNALK